MSLFALSTHRVCGLTPRAARLSAVVFAAWTRSFAATGVRHHATKPTPATTTQSAAGDILVQQRLRRPLSPHLGIYKWQITSVPSTLTRITGVVMSFSFYLFGALYLVSPVLGLNMSSAAIAAAFGAWPVALQILTKATLAWPFTFHAFNGLRYLCWDMTIGVNNKTVAQTGWTAVVASFVATLALAILV